METCMQEVYCGVLSIMLPVNEWEKQAREKKKMNGNTVATKALANFMGSSRAWLTLLSHLELRSEGQPGLCLPHGEGWNFGWDISLRPRAIYGKRHSCKQPAVKTPNSWGTRCFRPGRVSGRHITVELFNKPKVWYKIQCRELSDGWLE